MNKIATNKKWSKLLDAISAHNLFKNSLTNRSMRVALSPVCTLAFAIDNLYTKPLSDGLHVAIAGAGLTDADNGGEGYKVLGLLLGINNIKVDLVGPSVHKDSHYAPNKEFKSHVGESVEVSTYETTIGDYIKLHKPDIIMMNHPGLEQFHKQWMASDEMPRCIEMGIDVFGVSYGDDEAEFDEYYLKAYGYTVEKSLKNPFLLDYSDEAEMARTMGVIGYEAIKSGMMNWGGEVWKIESGREAKPDPELLAFLEDVTKYNSAISRTLEDPSSFPALVDAKDQHGGSWVVVRVHPEVLLYSREEGLICSTETNLIVLSDVELDVTYLKSADKKSRFQSLMISAIINRDYAEEIEEFIVDYHEDEEDEDGEAGAIEDFMKKLMGADVDLSHEDEVIQQNINKGAKHLKDSFTSDSLREFRDSKNRTLLHLAITNNDKALYDLCKDINIDASVRDTDDFSVLDTCAERGSVDFYELIRKDFDIDINDRDWKGYSAYNRAQTYGQAAMIKHMESIGADTSESEAQIALGRLGLS